MAKEKLTRGETIYKYRNELTVVDGQWEIDGKKLPKRMSKKEAMEYYNAKLWDAWIRHGYTGTTSAIRKLAWKDWWHMASHIIEALPVKWQIRLRDLFAIGYSIGYEKGKESGDV